MSRLVIRRSWLLSFALLAACELQPAPKQQAEPPPAPAPAPVAPPPVVADAGVDAAPQLQLSDQCRAVGIHIAAVVISSATDPGQRSIYEQDREKIARATAEACTTQGWSETAATCFLGSKTAPDLKKCEQKHLPQMPARPPGAGSAAAPDRDGQGTGSGSAAPPRQRVIRDGAGAGSAAQPARPGAGSAAQPARPGAGSAAQPARPGAGSAAQPARPGAGSAAQPARPGAGSAAPRR